MVILLKNNEKLEFLITTLRYRFIAKRNYAIIYEENPKFKKGDLELINSRYPDYLLRYIDLLFEELSSERTITFEVLLIVFTALHELKWYLLARLRYFLTESEETNLLKLIKSKPLSWLKLIILEVLETFIDKNNSEEDGVRQLNTISLFDSIENRTKDKTHTLKLGYIEGKSYDKVELMLYLSEPKFLNAPTRDCGTLSNLEKSIGNICELAHRLSLTNIELILLLLSTYPDCQNWVLNKIRFLAGIEKVPLYELLHQKSILWTEVTVYNQIPLFLVHEALIDINTTLRTRLTFRGNLLEKLRKEINRLKAFNVTICDPTPPVDLDL